MKTDAELATLLRSTLAGRAESIRAGARLPTPPDELRKPLPGMAGSRHRWLAAAAAAAVVATVAGGVVALNRDGQRTGSSGTALCVAEIPQAWRSTWTHDRVDLGGGRIDPARVVRIGKATVAVVVSPGPLRLVYIPDGGAPQTLYSAPRRRGIATFAAAGHWIVVTEEATSAPQQDSPATRILSIDVGTRQQRVVATAAGTPLDYAGVADGAVYYSTRPSPAAVRSTAHRYLLATRATTTIGHAAARQDPYLKHLVHPSIIATPSGVYWQFPPEAAYRAPVPVLRFTLPGAVTARLDPRHPDIVVSDGTAYAWHAVNGDVMWWTPGLAQPRRYGDKDAAYTIDGVAGPVIIAETGPELLENGVIDGRTGAAFNADRSGFAATPNFPTGGLYPLSHIDVDGFATQLYRVDATRLPRLGCR